MIFHDLFELTSATAEVCEPIRVMGSPDKIVASEFLLILYGKLQMVNTIIKIVSLLVWSHCSPFAGVFSSNDIVLSCNGLSVVGI